MSITPLSHSATMRKRATWMSAVPQDRTLFDLTLPGTHHSASCSISSSSFSTAICRRNAQCQSLTITQQLHAGVRSFDVRLRLGSDGVIRASHSMRATGWLRLEHLFVSIEDVVQQLAAFVESHTSEVIVVIIDTDTDPPDWRAMPGGCWQRVYRMFQPLLGKLLPHDQRMLPLGAITAGGRNLCVVCQHLRDVYGDVFWPWSALKWSWGETCSYVWRELHHHVQHWVDKHPVVARDGVFHYLQCEITQGVSTVIQGRTICEDAEYANAVLLHLLRGSLAGVPLQIVTHDFCNDHVLDALISRNMIAVPSFCPVAVVGSGVLFPDELKLCEQMTSSNGRYSTSIVPGFSADSCAFQVTTLDNVCCFSLPLPVSIIDAIDCVLRLDAAGGRLACVHVRNDQIKHDKVVWSTDITTSCSSFSFWRSRALLPQALVLTDCGELEVVQQQNDGGCRVLWSSGSRLVKLNTAPSSQAAAAAATGVSNSDAAPTDNADTPLRLHS